MAKRRYVGLDLDSWHTTDKIAQSVHAEVPGFGAIIDSTHFTVVMTARQFLRLDDQDAALQIVGQAVNDFLDLLQDLYWCRGRPATRSARALIEHLVNLLDVVSDAELARRYIDHGVFMAEAEAEAAVGEEWIRGSEQRANRHRLRKLKRDSRAAIELVVAKYGSSFRKSWSGEPLRKRAAQHGVSSYYAYYRLSSQVLHGSAGGGRGTVNNYGKTKVHRFGPALALLPAAYYEGVRAFERITTTMGRLVAEADIVPLQRALVALAETWPYYQRATTNVDSRLWPDEPPSGPFAVLAISRSGARRWYCYDHQLGLIAEASPPRKGELSDTQAESIEQLLSTTQLVDLPLEDQWLTIQTEGVSVTPLPGARWINAAAILVPDTFGRRLPKPIEVELMGDSGD